ncbi:MAG: hypothetical protein HKN79_07225, partial [Flavobacteriales bacterium]|nr:hypothetical protein [Flavobacteriales bacterium]
MAKYTLDGDFVWTQKHGETTEDKASDMVVKDGKIYLTGLFKGPFDALDGPGEVWV